MSRADTDHHIVVHQHNGRAVFYKKPRRNFSNFLYLFVLVFSVIAAYLLACDLYLKGYGPVQLDSLNKIHLTRGCQLHCTGWKNINKNDGYCLNIQSWLIRKMMRIYFHTEFIGILFTTLQTTLNLSILNALTKSCFSII